MSRARVSTLTPNEDVSRLASVLYHRVRKTNPYLSTRLSHTRRSISGSAGAPGPVAVAGMPLLLFLSSIFLLLL